MYRPQQDDDTRIEHRVGDTNRDNNGEYWVVNTTDGTQYYFGQNQVGGGHANTESVSAVPVFGNHSGEPCHADASPTRDAVRASSRPGKRPQPSPPSGQPQLDTLAS